MRDIYNPPPAAAAIAPPVREPLRFQRGDFAWLAALSVVLTIAAGWISAIEPTVWPWVVGGGLVVVLESWFSALTFLQRHPEESQRTGRRWMIFLAALVPWMLELGFAAALILALFLASEWANS